MSELLSTWVAPVALTLGVAVLLLATRKLATALGTLRARSLTPTLSRRLAHWVRPRSYSDEQFFRADGAGPDTVASRRRGLDRLAGTLRDQYSASRAWGAAIREGFSDLRFTDANRVPFPFARVMRERFDLCSVVTASDGPYLQTLDGHATLDVGGSYGVNVAGYGRYKEWMARGLERVRDLGPVLGPLHPVTAENIARLRRISGLDEVSFHMSGTEAVMAAVRLARFNTGRKLIVCFSGAYHGWWDGVQPGLGSERPLDDCLTLKDLNPASLDVIRRRAGEIAAVLVNPVQSFHPNAPPPSDAVLLTSGVRRTEEGTERYAEWLRRLRAVCREASVPLIFDEVYTGFRLAPGGAQEYFGVAADMVVYGKTVAGGMPIGVVCGTKALMRRFDPERPMRIAYVIGTFSGHPVVMGAMNEFLRWVVEPATGGLYDEMNERCTQWVRGTNRALVEAALPIRVVHLGTVWTVLFTEPGRYNWLLQYYLRAEGVSMSWVGTGRCLSSMDFTEKDYEALQTKLLSAAHAMNADGWWPRAAENPGRERRMRRQLIREVAGKPGPGAPAPADVLHGDHAPEEGRPSRLAQRPDQPALPHHQLERVPRLLRARVLGSHHRDVGGPGRSVPAPARPRGPGAALPRQGGNPPRLQHAQQDDRSRRVPDDSRDPPPARARVDRHGAGAARGQHRPAVVRLDPARGRRAGRLPDVGPERVAGHGMARQAGHRSAHRHRRVLAPVSEALLTIGPRRSP